MPSIIFCLLQGTHVHKQTVMVKCNEKDHCRREGSFMDRIIMHVDMDAFFASVEQLDAPSLRGKPVIVGGTSGRGVVATCSYEARKYGVHSAMPVFMAKKLCPEGVYLPTRFYRYKEMSNRIFEILHGVTPLIEPLSIDEAYLDASALNMKPLDMAMNIKKTVRKETGLTISVGVSYNKFLAKLASDWNKPDGLKIITRDMVPDILLPLPVGKVYGMGEKSVQKMHNIGVYTVEDMMKLPRELFIACFGKFGVEIYDRIRGVDNREVKVERERKSIGKETTLQKDTKDKEKLKGCLEDFAREIAQALKAKNMSCRTVTVKIKTCSFENHTKSRTLLEQIRDQGQIASVAWGILDGVELEQDIRLIGLSVSGLKDNGIEQLSFEHLL